MSQRIQIVGVMVVGVLAMASASILIRLAQSEGVPSLVIAAYRMVLASSILTIPAIRQQAWKDYAKLTRREGGWLIVSGILLGLHFAAWITSLAHTSILSSVALVSSTPLWIGLASPLALKEKTPRLTWAGILVAMIGGAVIGLNDVGAAKGQAGWGDALALLGAMFAAAYLIIGRSARSQVSLTAYVWIVYGTAAVFLLVWAGFAELSFVGYSGPAFVWLGLLALIPQLIGHTAANYGVRRLPATLVGISILGEPVGSTILAVVLLRETPTAVQVIGAVLVLAGIGMALITSKTIDASASRETPAVNEAE